MPSWIVGVYPKFSGPASDYRFGEEQMFNISSSVSVGCIPSRASLKAFTVDVLGKAPKLPTASDSTTVG
jgi:hypothetical protein